MSIDGESSRKRLIRVENQSIHDPENDSKCPGYRIVGLPRPGTPREAVVRCDTPHPHRDILRVEYFDDGTVNRILERQYGPSFKPESEVFRWSDTPISEFPKFQASQIGLESRDNETIGQHAARCLAYMHRRAGNDPDLQAIVQRISKAAKIPELEALEAVNQVQELELSEAEYNARMDRLRRQAQNLDANCSQ